MKYILEANKEFEYLKTIRRKLHKCPEIGFDVYETKKIIIDEINKIGYKPITIGNNGVLVNIKGNSNKTLLFRCDIDALPIKEKTNLSFKSKNNNMHACGHDLHTSIMLGVLKIIKKYEKTLKNNIKVLFQPAEEILSGAKNMIENNVLKNPSVDMAFMCHVLPSDIEVGKIIVPRTGVIAPSSDFFEIKIKGKESHGAMPHLGVDATYIGVHIFLALEELVTREKTFNDKVMLTIGEFNSGVASNIISSTSILKGTLRTNSEDIRKKLKKRMEEVVENISKTYKGRGEITFTSGCPSLINDEKIKDGLLHLLNKCLKNEYILEENINSSLGVGSEDFAYFSRVIPSYMVSISSGPSLPLHNPKVVFDETLMINGTSYFLAIAFEF